MLIKVKEAIIVEGKYDKIKLRSFIDATIITTNGFRIFKNKKQVEMIKRLSHTNGILILTDSDAAGFMIRNHIKNIAPNGSIKQAYIPDIYGKEKRKEKPSKEGKLGVEGVSQSIIIEAIIKSGATIKNAENNIKQENQNAKVISKLDFFEDGLSGGEKSKEKRLEFIKYLNLPEHLSTNSLLEVVNNIITYDEYKNIINILSNKQ